MAGRDAAIAAALDEPVQAASSWWRKGMDLALLTVIGIVVVALLFDYTNGFHDSANSISTIVAKKARPTPQPRIGQIGQKYPSWLVNTHTPTRNRFTHHVGDQHADEVPPPPQPPDHWPRGSFWSMVQPPLVNCPSTQGNRGDQLDHGESPSRAQARGSPMPRVRVPTADQGQDDQHAGVGVAGPEQVLADRVVQVTRAAAGDEAEQGDPPGRPPWAPAPETRPRYGSTPPPSASSLTGGEWVPGLSARQDDQASPPR